MMRGHIAPETTSFNQAENREQKETDLETSTPLKLCLAVNYDHKVAKGTQICQLFNFQPFLLTPNKLCCTKSGLEFTVQN